MIRVLMDRVLVEIEPIKDVSFGGIILPETREERDRIGTVVSVGGRVKEVKVGDRVIYNVYSQMTEADGRKFRVVKEENVLCVIEDPDLDVRLPKGSSGAQVAWENLDD